MPARRRARAARICADKYRRGRRAHLVERHGQHRRRQTRADAGGGDGSARPPRRRRDRPTCRCSRNAIGHTRCTSRTARHYARCPHSRPCGRCVSPHCKEKRIALNSAEKGGAQRKARRQQRFAVVVSRARDGCPASSTRWGSSDRGERAAGQPAHRLAGGFVQDFAGIPQSRRARRESRERRCGGVPAKKVPSDVDYDAPTQSRPQAPARLQQRGFAA